MYKVADTFVQEWCVSLISHMLRRSKWGPEKWRTSKGTRVLSEKLGEQLIDIVLPLLAAELAAVTAVPFARISPTKV